MCLIKFNSCSEAILYFKTSRLLLQGKSLKYEFFQLTLKMEGTDPTNVCVCLYSWMWVVKQEHNTAQFNTKIVVSKTLMEDLSPFWEIYSSVLRSLSGSVGKELPPCHGSFEIVRALCGRLGICPAKV